MCYGCSNLINLTLHSSNENAKLYCPDICYGCTKLESITFAGNLT